MQFKSFCVAGIVCVASVLLTAPAAGQFPEYVDPGSLDGTNGFTVVGYRYQEFGFKVAGIGDVNADGIDDIATGGPGCAFPPPDFLGPCNPGTESAGATYVIFGRSDIGGDGSWNPQDLDGTNGFRVEGLYLSSQTGAVAPAGDFNNDGIADVLVGAPTASPFGTLAAGEAYMIYGRAGLGGQGSFDLTTLDGSNGFTIRGTNALGGIGNATHMAHVGDFNGDGVSDVALGDSGADPGGRRNAGQTYVLFGGSEVAESGSLTLPNDLTPELGIVFNGISPGASASRVASAGDFNGDGVDDLLIMSAADNPPSLPDGQVHLIYGGLDPGEMGVFELSDVNSSTGIIINSGACSGPLVANRILAPAGVGDINADGCDDIAISVDSGDDWVAVIFGGPDVAPQGFLCLDDLNGDNGFRVVRKAGSISTVGVTTAPGDLNDDGVADLFIRMLGGRVIYGDPAVGSSGTVAIDDLDGRNGFQSANAGRVRSYAGDVNNDGIDDIITGSKYEDEEFVDIGRIFLVFGRRMGDGDIDADVDLDDYAAFRACVGLLKEGDVPDACHPFDLDKDNDVDLLDWGAFQTVFNTPP
ncbi:MAG: integrin alpha [Phycisphaerae bacterium]